MIAFLLLLDATLFLAIVGVGLWIIATSDKKPPDDVTMLIHAFYDYADRPVRLYLQQKGWQSACMT